MQRRGPRKTTQKTSANESEAIRPSDRRVCRRPTVADDMALRKDIISMAQLPFGNKLTPNESFLLNHYIQRFSRTYPTCCDPTNPFLSILLPLAMEHRAVLNAVLALSGAQFGPDHDFAITRVILQLRHRALEGCRNLVAKSEAIFDPNAPQPVRNPRATQGEESILFTLACCVCLLLYEKIVGDGKANWMPHLAFLAGLFDRLESPANRKTLESVLRGNQQRRAFWFLHNIFLYNDLVQSTATGASTLSKYYLRIPRRGGRGSSDVSFSANGVYPMRPEESGNMRRQGRFYFPYLIAQISSRNETVSDACIDAWDGRLDWLPSFSITFGLSDSFVSPSIPSENISTQGDDACPAAKIKVSNEKSLVSTIYRCAAKVYLRQITRRRKGHRTTPQLELDMANLACHATFLISQLSEGSSFENTLLWPIGIIGPELLVAHAAERYGLLCRLQKLERRFQMKHFERMQEVLLKKWNQIDRLVSGEKIQDDVFLFG